MPRLISFLMDTLSEVKLRVRIIDDNTAEKIQELRRIHGNIEILVRPNRVGLGSACRDGFKISTGKSTV